MTASSEASERTIEEREFAESILETLRDPLLVLDDQMVVLSANDAFFESFSVTRQDTLGKRVYDLGNGQWNIPALRELLGKTLSESRAFRDYQVDHAFKDIGRRVMLLNGRRVFDKGKQTETILLVIEDITERKRRERFIHFQAAALNSVNDAVVALDREDRVTYWNAPAERLFEEPRIAVLGRPIAKVCSLVETEGVGDGAALFAPREGGERWVEHHVRIKKSGKEMWLESSTTEIEADDFAPGRLVVLRDTTERKRKDLELLREKEGLELFASLASHDLQEPLRMIAASVALLRRRYRGKLDSEANRYIDYSIDGVTRMKQLIKDLLRYAQTHIDPRHMQRVPLAEIVSAALDGVLVSLQESGAEVRVGPLPDVVVDASLMRQVFQNLFSNSLKYRSEAPPLILVTAEEDEDRGWIVCVKDNGRGFDEKEVTRVFQLFQRLDPRKTAGTGLGLTLTKKIVEAHGGKIWARSKVGEGTTVSFFLPRRSDASSASGPSPA